MILYHFVKYGLSTSTNHVYHMVNLCVCVCVCDTRRREAGKYFTLTEVKVVGIVLYVCMHMITHHHKTCVFLCIILYIHLGYPHVE